MKILPSPKPRYGAMRVGGALVQDDNLIVATVEDGILTYEAHIPRHADTMASRLIEEWLAAGNTPDPFAS